MATDSVSKNSSIAMVTIQLRDVNDHRPTFPQNSYVLSVLENSPTGSVVTSSIHVSDRSVAGPGWEGDSEKGGSGGLRPA